MAAAALGITPEATQEVIVQVMTFVQTADARISEIEILSRETHAMMRDLHRIEFPEKYNGQLEVTANGGTAADGGNTGRVAVID